MLRAHPIFIGRAMEKQRLAVRAFADEQRQIAGFDYLDFEPRRQHVQRAARIYDECARHLASCRSQVAGAEVDQQLRAVVEGELLAFLEDSACIGDIGVKILCKLALTQ